MNAGHIIGRGILGAIVLGCICISAVFAFEFGWSKGETSVHRWAFGLAGGGLDLLKAALPILAAGSASRLKSRLSWAAFSLLTVMSLWCAWGTTAGQLAERMGNKAVETSKQTGAQGRLESAKAERASMKFDYADDATVRAAEDAVETARAAAAQECDRVGTNCRKRRAEENDARARLTKVMSDRTATKRHADLSAKIDAAESALDAVDTKKLAMDADPQAASIAKATGWSEAAIAAFSHLLFAIGIEVGSGLGLWLVFGHGDEKRRGPDVVAVVAQAEPVKAPADTPLLQDSIMEIRAKFFRECVKVEKGPEISGKRMHRAYVGFCERLGEAPMSQTAFGMDSPLDALKHKTNRGIVYRNCAFVAGMVDEVVEAPVARPEIVHEPVKLRLVAYNAAPA
jgi:hypothetical protein